MNQKLLKQLEKSQEDNYLFFTQKDNTWKVATPKNTLISCGLFVVCIKGSSSTIALGGLNNRPFISTYEKKKPALNPPFTADILVNLDTKKISLCLQDTLNTAGKKEIFIDPNSGLDTYKISIVYQTPSIYGSIFYDNEISDNCIPLSSPKSIDLGFMYINQMLSGDHELYTFCNDYSHSGGNEDD